MASAPHRSTEWFHLIAKNGWKAKVGSKPSIFQSWNADKFDHIFQWFIFSIVGLRRTALGGATTRPARSSAENCERANISKTLTTTLTTSSETSTTSAELGTRLKMLPERRKRNPPPQVATTQRALEHHLVLLRRRNQVQAKIILLFTSKMVKVGLKFSLIDTAYEMLVCYRQHF